MFSRFLFLLYIIPPFSKFTRPFCKFFLYFFQLFSSISTETSKPIFKQFKCFFQTPNFRLNCALLYGSPPEIRRLCYVFHNIISKNYEKADMRLNSRFLCVRAFARFTKLTLQRLLSPSPIIYCYIYTYRRIIIYHQLFILNIF